MNFLYHIVLLVFNLIDGMIKDIIKSTEKDWKEIGENKKRQDS